MNQNQKPATRDQKRGRSAAFWVLISGFWFCLFSCNHTNIDRAEWQTMSSIEKTLYVRTLLGHEKANEAKGGKERVFQQTADEYVKRIDDAYAHGDKRNVDAIFEEMGRMKTRNQKPETRMLRSTALSALCSLVSGFWFCSGTHR